MNCQRYSFRFGAVAALCAAGVGSVSLGAETDATLADRAAEALWLLSEPSLDRPEGIIPADSVVDFVAWQDDLLHIELTLPLPEDDAVLSPTDVEFISATLAAMLDPHNEGRGLVVWCRRDPAEAYRLIEEFVPVVEPGVYVEPDDVAPPVDAEPGAPLTAPTERDAAATTISHQPTGALTGVVVYAAAGHGWTAQSWGWALQRPLLLNMVEDYGNIDQLNYFVEYCFNAGATVVPFRPVGYQVHEVVLDQDDPEVTYSGAWINSTGSPYYENNRTISGVSYRFAVTNSTQTAFARYTPNLPTTDSYPVYTWVLNSSNRTLQKYRIMHTGGTSEVTVDHRLVGKGWVWLGNYHFNAGTGGYVEISNQSTVSGNVIADAIRFGNGMGDVVGAGPGTISGYAREEECSRYWAESETNINANGLSSSIYDCCTSDSDDNVGTGARWAREMNNESIGSRWNRVYLEFHTNASTGAARGSVALITGSATTNQALFADIMGEEIEEDMQILDGVVPFEYTWATRGNTYTSSYGAISTTNNGNEFDATIIEVAYHDNTEDAALLLDPKVRDAVGRSSMHGIIKFLNSISAGAVPLAFPPDRPRRVQAVHNGSGGIVLSWQAPLAGEAYGGAATGYRVYRSSNGYGFDAGQDVGSGLSTTLADIPANTTTYLRITATNAGGESMPSETLAVRRPATAATQVLIVNGFDRVGRLQDPTQTIPAGTMRRPILRRVNSFDYTIQHAVALAASDVTFDSCANEAVIAGTVPLAGYDAVVWILGEESSADRTFDATEQTLVTAYLNGGGGLFVSGAEIGWDLDYSNNGQSFFRNTLGGTYIGDDGASYTAIGAGGILAGLGTFSFAPANGAPYDAEYPDRIGPQPGAMTVLNYFGGTGDSAGIQYDAGTYRVVMLGLPFETITSASTRATIMTEAMEFLLPDTTVPADCDGDGDVDLTDFGIFSTCFNGPNRPPVYPGSCDIADLDGDSDVDLTDFGMFAACFNGPNRPPACAE